MSWLESFHLPVVSFSYSSVSAFSLPWTLFDSFLPRLMLAFTLNEFLSADVRLIMNLQLFTKISLFWVSRERPVALPFLHSSHHILYMTSIQGYIQSTKEFCTAQSGGILKNYSFSISSPHFHYEVETEKLPIEFRKMIRCKFWQKKDKLWSYQKDLRYMKGLNPFFENFDDKFDCCQTWKKKRNSKRLLRFRKGSSKQIVSQFHLSPHGFLQMARCFNLWLFCILL